MNVTGVLKERLTNVGTGKSIVVNVSGPATEIMHPDDSADLTLEGSDLVSYNARFNPRWSGDVHLHRTHGFLVRPTMAS